MLNDFKYKGDVAQDTFLDFTDVRSYLIFKCSVWKRGCIVSFELQMPQTFSTPFRKAHTKF